jgi:hypothetical protein
MNMTADSDQAALDSLVRDFFAAFTNTNGNAPNVRRIYDLAIPEAVIVKGAGPAPEIYSLREFVEPRQDTQGTKMFQFVRLPGGWLLSALSWADEPDTGGRR